MKQQSYNKKIVTITGALGFLGIHLTRLFLSKGWKVIGIDSITYVSNIDQLQFLNKNSNFKFIQSDINDLDFLHETDYVIHTAACSHVTNSIIDSKEFIRTNINGTYNILELIRNYRFDKKPLLIALSTDEVYGDILKGKHIETDILKPSNPYSASKASADQLIIAWGRTYNIPYIIVRPTNMWGKGQYPEKLIPKMVKYLTLGKKLSLHNGGKPIRNWLHVQDCCRAIDILIEKGENKQIYNICGGYEQSNIDTVNKIIDEYVNSYAIKRVKIDIDKYINFDYNREGQDIRYALDDKKIRKLGWKPEIKFDKELPEVVEYYTKNFIW